MTDQRRAVVANAVRCVQSIRRHRYPPRTPRWMTVTADKDGRGGTDALSNIRCRPRNEFSPRGLRTLRHTTRDLDLGQRGISPTSGGRARPTSPIDPRYGNRCRPNAARIGAYSACGRRDARRERGSAYLLSSSRLRPTKPNRAITQSMAVMAMALGSIASSVWYLISAHRQPENRLINSSRGQAWLQQKFRSLCLRVAPLSSAVA